MSANKSYTYNSQEPIAQINTDGVHLQFETSINQNGNNHIIVEEAGTINSYTLHPTFLEAIQSTIDAAVSKSMGRIAGAKFVRTAWRSLVSDECAQHFAWSGTSDKKPVRVLKVSMAIRDVFLHEVKGNDTKYISGTKTIFQFAKNRQKRKHQNAAN